MFKVMCLCVCERICSCVYMITLEDNVLIAVSSHAYYIMIVNDIIDCNSSLFSVSVFMFLWSERRSMRICVYIPQQMSGKVTACYAENEEIN